MTTPPLVTDPSRRDRKKRATRRDLSLAALNLVLERGVANVTVEDIAGAADVSTRTFFNYFPSKEAAIIGHDPERVDRIRDRLLGRPAEESPFTALKNAMVFYVAELVEEANEFGEGRSDWLRRLHAVKSDPHLYGAYVAHMSLFEKACVAALGERMGVDPDENLLPSLFVGSVLVAVRVALMCWVAGGGVASAEQLLAESIDALGSGLASNPEPNLKLPAGSLPRIKNLVSNYGKGTNVSS